ncbi:MAG: hypothetical protein KME43_14465 [Myxacorys chilensis ATA2-1-KO14]|jgi:hypothetical protein|nr:hypothetical protein [Myxacorys chilensis ATA2-1-KO14]
MSKKRRDPLPSNLLGQRLCEIFPYPWKAIIRANESDSQWSTVSYNLSPRLLWQKWQEESELVGVRFGSKTRYALIDIDRNSAYHPAQNPESLPLVRAALETIGICRTILIRSSWSEGLHLYIPLSSTVPTFGLAKAIKLCLEAQGFAISQGQLEIFPNCKTYALSGSFTEYNGHRLPLQLGSGSCLLDHDGNPEGDDLATFLQRWDIAAGAQDLDDLINAIGVAKLKPGRLGKRHSPNLENWRQDLETEIEEGWTAHGQTNYLLKKIACYGVVFEQLQEDSLAEFIYQTAISSPGYEQWCRHQHEILSKAKAWARAAENYYWPLGSAPKRSATGLCDDKEKAVSINVIRAEDAQRRIREAVSRLEQNGQLPATTKARMKALQAEKISSRTLYRYAELWHPEHYQPSSMEVCKTQELEKLSAISNTEFEELPKSLEPSLDKRFYTLKKI